MLNPLIQYVPLENNAGAFTPIRVKSMARWVKVYEDPAQNAGQAQGLTGNWVDTLSGVLTPAAPGGAAWLPPAGDNAGDQPIYLGDPHSVHGGLGVPVSAPGAPYPVLQLRSASANATQVVVEEYP